MATVSFVYSIPYLTIAVLLFSLSNFEWKKQTKEITIIFVFIILLVFWGLRGHLYTDYINYYPFFQQLPDITNLTWRYFANNEFENGFVIYSSIIKTICPSYYFWIFVNSLIDLIILTYFFKKYSNSTLWSYIFLFGFMGLIIEINLLRNAKSIMLFLLSLPFLMKRKFLPYLFLNLIGASFHSSSFLYIFVYFILNTHFSITAIITAFVTTNIVFLFKIPVLSEFISIFSEWMPANRGVAMLLRYVDNSDSQYLFSIGYIERTAAYIITAVYYKKLIRNNSMNKVFCNSLFLYYILFYICAEIEVLTTRVPLLFAFSYWFVFPNILALVPKRFSTKVYVLTFIFCCLKISTSTDLIIHKYDNWLMGGIESFEHRKILYENNPEIQ